MEAASQASGMEPQAHGSIYAASPSTVRQSAKVLLVKVCSVQDRFASTEVYRHARYPLYFSADLRANGYHTRWPLEARCAETCFPSTRPYALRLRASEVAVGGSPPKASGSRQTPDASSWTEGDPRSAGAADAAPTPPLGVPRPRTRPRAPRLPQVAVGGAAEPVHKRLQPAGARGLSRRVVRRPPCLLSAPLCAVHRRPLSSPLAAPHRPVAVPIVVPRSEQFHRHFALEIGGGNEPRRSRRADAKVG